MKSVTTIEKATDILKTGGVGVMPTDTVYGLVTRAANKAAVARMYALKRREHKPGTVIAASVEQLVGLGLNEADIRAAAYLWPDSVSLVAGADDELAYLHQGLDSLAVRVPKDAGLRAVLEQTGVLVTSSANAPGEPTSVNLDEAWAYFGDAVDFYVDGGDMSGRAPSTIVRVMDGRIEVLRQGAVNIEGRSVHS